MCDYCRYLFDDRTDWCSLIDEMMREPFDKVIGLNVSLVRNDDKTATLCAQLKNVYAQRIDQFEIQVHYCPMCGQRLD